MKNLVALKTFCSSHGIPFRQDVPLGDLCTFKIGGPASCVAWPGNEEQLGGLVRLLSRGEIPYLILGRGSNVLFADEGFDGAAVCLAPPFARMRLTEDGLVFCESGAALSQLCLFAQAHGLSGLEFAYGIPGTVGGAVYMNAGAYGGEMQDVLVRTEHILPDGSAGSFQGEEMDLSYRHSAYSGSGLVITGAYFRLTPGDGNEIRARMEDYMGRRREKQPLEYPSAGSTFRRPPGDYASALIDRCGLKGRRIGGAVVSERHAGFIVNDGGATCADVLALIEIIKDEVRRQTGCELCCEVKIIGNR